MMQEKIERLLPLAEVAVLMGVCRRTVYRLIAGGELPQPVKIGASSRLPESEVARYVEQQKAKRGR